jgi:elongation factor Ts
MNMKITMNEIKRLREKTGAGVMDAKKALEESKGDIILAEAWIAKKGIIRAEGKADRETAQGLVYAYVHHNGKAGALVKLLCETDFVAKTDDFANLAKELAMQVVSMRPKDVRDLLAQVYVRDGKISVEELVKQVSGKLGENIKVSEFARLTI